MYVSIQWHAGPSVEPAVVVSAHPPTSNPHIPLLLYVDNCFPCPRAIRVLTQGDGLRPLAPCYALDRAEWTPKRDVPVVLTVGHDVHVRITPTMYVLVDAWSAASALRIPDAGEPRSAPASTLAGRFVPCQLRTATCTVEVDCAELAPLTLRAHWDHLTVDVGADVLGVPSEVGDQGPLLQPVAQRGHGTVAGAALSATMRTTCDQHAPAWQIGPIEVGLHLTRTWVMADLAGGDGTIATAVRTHAHVVAVRPLQLGWGPAAWVWANAAQTALAQWQVAYPTPAAPPGRRVPPLTMAPSAPLVRSNHERILWESHDDWSAHTWRQHHLRQAAATPGLTAPLRREGSRHYCYPLAEPGELVLDEERVQRRSDATNDSDRVVLHHVGRNGSASAFAMVRWRCAGATSCRGRLCGSER